MINRFISSSLIDTIKVGVCALCVYVCIFGNQISKKKNPVIMRIQKMISMPVYYILLWLPLATRSAASGGSGGNKTDWRRHAALTDVSVSNADTLEVNRHARSLSAVFDSPVRP